MSELRVAVDAPDRYLLFIRRSRRRLGLGRSPDSEVAADLPRAASPSPVSTEWCYEATASLTVAGPRRNFTGFPVMPTRAPRRQEPSTSAREVASIRSHAVSGRMFASRAPPSVDVRQSEQAGSEQQE